MGLDCTEAIALLSACRHAWKQIWSVEDLQLEEREKKFRKKLVVDIYNGWIVGQQEIFVVRASIAYQLASKSGESSYPRANTMVAMNLCNAL